MPRIRNFSAPTGLFLLGEYAADYGKPCLVAALNKRVKVTFELLSSSLILLSSDDYNLHKYPVKTRDDSDQPEEMRKIIHALQVILSTFSDVPGLHVTVSAGGNWKTSEIPAIIACFIKGIATILHLKFKRQELFDAVVQVYRELDSQSVSIKPLIAAAIYGGIIRYENTEKPVQKLKEYPELSLLHVQIPGQEQAIPVLVRWQKKYEEALEATLTSIGELTDSGFFDLEKGRIDDFGVLVNRNQKLLQELAVVSDDIHKVCVKAMLADACGAKLTGYGMDTVLIITKEKKQDKVLALLRKAKDKVAAYNVSDKGITEDR